MLLHGVNLGGWLLMEGYILGGRNIPVQRMKADFCRQNGRKALHDFENAFQTNFITEQDFKLIASWGTHVVRIPFHHRLIEDWPFHYSPRGIAVLKTVLTWAQKYALKVILDLHAACGAQNYDWHSDSTGRARLWGNEWYQKRTCALWRFIAGQVKDMPALIGYDVLNEPVLDRTKIRVLERFYRNCIREIRSVDKQTMIYLEGNTWAQDIDFLQDLLGEHIGVSIHTYAPHSFTFHFKRGSLYPGQSEGELWNKDRLLRHLQPYKDFSVRHNVPVYAGEFGINWRGNTYGELRWLEDILSLFQDLNFSWTYWTYKAVSNPVFPDGIVQYQENPAWVRREGPVYGFENFPLLWKQQSAEMIKSWQSDQWTVNSPLLDILKHHF